MFAFHLGKASLSSCLFVSHRHFFAYEESNLVFRKTRVEDTHLTLAAILWVNNSLNFFAVSNIQKKIAEFPFLWDL